MSNDLLDRVRMRLRRNVEEAEANVRKAKDIVEQYSPKKAVVSRWYTENRLTDAKSEFRNTRMILEAFEEAVRVEKAENDGGGE